MRKQKDCESLSFRDKKTKKIQQTTEMRNLQLLRKLLYLKPVNLIMEGCMTMFSVKIIAIRILMTAGIIFCLSANLYSEEKITVAGTGANESIVKALAEAYMKTNKDAKIDVTPSIGTGGGIKGVLEGKIELGRIGRPLTEEEKKQGAKEMIFTKSPIVFIVNKNSKITNLTSKQICDIYSGKITNWKEVGGENKKIYIIARPVSDAAHIEIVKSLKGFKDITLSDKIIIEKIDEDAIKSVEDKDGTIGYGIIVNMIGRKVNAIAIDGIKYSNKEYGIFSLMGFCYKDELKGLAKKFTDFIFSPAGEKIIKQMESSPVK